MATTPRVDGDDLVVLVLTNDPSGVTSDEVYVSALEMERWDVPSLLQSRVVRIGAVNRRTLVQHSSYFRGLLEGSFSESSRTQVSIHWNPEVFIDVLQFVHCGMVNITLANFLLLLEGALFFGVDALLLECTSWFHKATSPTGQHCPLIPVDAINEIWKFSLDHGTGVITELCCSYIAQNFATFASSHSLLVIHYSLLCSCIEHPQLTVNSEKQLQEALLSWLICNKELKMDSSNDLEMDYLKILGKIRIHLLPLGYAAGKRRNKYVCKIADKSVLSIIDLMNNYSSLLHLETDDELKSIRIRLTQYSKKIELQGCVQFKLPLLFAAAISPKSDFLSKKRVIETLVELDHHRDNYSWISREFSLLSFDDVYYLDVSKCPKVHSGAIINLNGTFPCLRVLKFTHCINFRIKQLFDLIENFPLMNEVDFTVDISPVIPFQVTVSSVSDRECKAPIRSPSLPLKNVFSLSNITKLTLEGRTDIDDLDLLSISNLANSLAYINLKGCTMLTDAGLARLVSGCIKLNSLIVSYTSFGRNSILAVCSVQLLLEDEQQYEHEHSRSLAFRLHELHIDGCKGIDDISMKQLVSQVCKLKSLSLKGTHLSDGALYMFTGVCLENLNVSETMVSMAALSYIIGRNTGLKILKMTGCKNLHSYADNNSTHITVLNNDDLYHKLCKNCLLEEVTLGWGFSVFSLKVLEPAIREVRSITVGIGASLSHEALFALPNICPLLEIVILNFQVISDTVMREILGSLKYLRVFGLCCCLGGITSQSFNVSMAGIRTLRLEWITPWMTNDDLVILSQNSPNLVELSLSGCKLLDPDAQHVISSGWPGLSYLHLEDCGDVMSNGVLSIFECIALEDLLLRHSGRGIRRNFVVEAASRLPLLHKIALDFCDACEGGFDTPGNDSGFFLSTVTIACCKRQRCSFPFERTAHKQTIVVEWNSMEMRTTIVKERV